MKINYNIGLFILPTFLIITLFGIGQMQLRESEKLMKTLESTLNIFMILNEEFNKENYGEYAVHAHNYSKDIPFKLREYQYPRTRLHGENVFKQRTRDRWWSQ